MRDGETEIKSPDGERKIVVSPPSGWLAEVDMAMGEMGRDMNGQPLATDRFAVLDEEGVTDPELRRVARRLWRCADAGRADAANERQREAEKERKRQARR